jgi:hypothetical protein
MSDRISGAVRRALRSAIVAALALFVPAGAQAAPILYGVTFDNELITIDTATGAGTLVGPLSSAMAAYGLGTVGTSLYTFDQQADLLRQLDPATGGTLASVNLGIGNLTGEGAVDFRSDGRGFLTTASPGANLYSFTTAGGGALVGSTSQVIDGLAFNSGDVLYGLVQGGATLVTINQTTGALTQVGLTGLSGGNLAGLAFLDDQTLYAVLTAQATAASTLYRLNPATGQATLVGGVGIDRVSGITFLETVQSPEPASLLLVGFGLAVAARRRLKASRP